MSDLFCAARVLVARHAEAAYPPGEAITDHGGWLTETGRAQARELAESLRQERIAEVVTSPLDRAVETGAIVAELLGVRSRTAAGLREFSVGSYAGTTDEAPLREIFARWLSGDRDERMPGGESLAELLDRFRGAVEELADSSRGETTVAISHGGIMSLALPRLAFNVDDELARQHEVPNCAIAEVLIDADGWALQNWPGRSQIQ